MEISLSGLLASVGIVADDPTTRHYRYCSSVPGSFIDVTYDRSHVSRGARVASVFPGIPQPM